MLKNNSRVTIITNTFPNARETIFIIYVILQQRQTEQNNIIQGFIRKIPGEMQWIRLNKPLWNK